MNIVDKRRVPIPSQKNYYYKGKRKNDKSLLKVVYISSPMKVKTSASRFRSLVQQLTGKNSDISQYMDDNNINYTTNRGGDFHEVDCVDDDESLAILEPSDRYQKLSSISPHDDDDDTPTSSESFLGQLMDSVFISQMKEQFEGIFSSDLFYDPSQMDVLPSFDDLL